MLDLSPDAPPGMARTTEAELAALKATPAQPARIVIDKETMITHVFYSDQDAQDWLGAMPVWPLENSGLRYLVLSTIRVHPIGRPAEEKP